MSNADDVFGADSSDDEISHNKISAGEVHTADTAGESWPSDVPESITRIDGANMPTSNSPRQTTEGEGEERRNDAFAESDSELPPASVLSPDFMAGGAGGLNGTGLSDSEDDLGDTTQDAASLEQQALAQNDLFGSDSESDGGGPVGAAGTKLPTVRNEPPLDDDPFGDSDDDAGGRGAVDNTSKMRRLSKASAGKASKDKPKKAKGKGKHKSDSSQDGKGPKKSQKDKSAKRKKKGDKGERAAGDKRGPKRLKKSGQTVRSSPAGLAGTGLSDSEPELEPEEPNSGGEEVEDTTNAQTKADDDFIDNSEDNPDLLEEYNRDAPLPGSDSEAEEDNRGEREDAPSYNNPMDSVLKSMKKHKAQDLSTAERETIAQEFLFKINKAAEDDEEAVLAHKPAINKLKLLKLVRATLAKKELQETFLEFDLLGVIKRWLQPYPNGKLPTLTVRTEMINLVVSLPIQIDHLKRSGIGRVVMGLLKCREETIENKRMLHQLVAKWNRPIYEKETSHRAMRAMQDDGEAIEVRAPGNNSSGRRGMMREMPRREGPGRDESVGNILNATARGPDPSKSRVPFSNGYAFAKAPRSRVEGHGRSTQQPVDSSARTKLLKKMAVLSRPRSSG